MLMGVLLLLTTSIHANTPLITDINDVLETFFPRIPTIPDSDKRLLVKLPIRNVPIAFKRKQF